MPGKKKKFIDKKSAVTFSLVHRSQKDPLQADDTSSSFVLQQLDNPNDRSKANRVEEQQKYGIYYEDDYDYMQHLRDTNTENAWELASGPAKSERKVHFDVEDLTKPGEKPKLQLPAGVFPSLEEEEVGLLNRAAPISGPRLDLDPDVVAAMDDDFDFGDPGNELEDDFVLMAQGDKDLPETPGDLEYDDDEEEEDEEEEEENRNEGSGEDYDSDELDDVDHMSYMSEETKSRFTNYSLTSSVVRRNDGLTLLDDRFEKLYEEYDDMEIGALDHDEIEGYVRDDSCVLTQVIGEFEEANKVVTMNEIEAERIGVKETEGEEEEEEKEEEEEEEKVKLYIEERKERWDCESVLSTYSTLYNHPTTIKEPTRHRSKKLQSTTPASSEPSQIKLSQKTGMPLDVLPSLGRTRKQQERAEFEETRVPMVTSSRKKGVKETSEEKRARKQAVQLARKERRVEKKANKQAFKDEEIRQEKVMQNVRQNLQGVKIL